MRCGPPSPQVEFSDPMIMSLWASAPVFAGGLGYATGEIGSILAITGAALIFFQILVYPSLNRCFGTLGLLRRLVLLQVLGYAWFRRFKTFA